MNTENQKPGFIENPEDRQRLLLAKVKELTEGLSADEMMQMMLTMISSTGITDEHRAFFAQSFATTEFDKAASTATPSPPGYERTSDDLIMMAFAQSSANLVFWYTNWYTNRDYSSVINLAIALGRNGMATSLLNDFADHAKDADLKKRAEKASAIGQVYWEDLQSSGGRIVPFNKE